jgi:rubrerythrin
VIWLGKKGLVRKEFEEDFGDALRTYHLLKSNGRKLVTLRCMNVGFPPPESVTAEEVVTWKAVTRKGKRYKVKDIATVNRMPALNDEGIWWCPYCIQLRPFKLTKDWTGQPHMVCPVCKVNERNFHVRQHNPKAIIVEYSRRRRRRNRGRSVRRRT